MSFFQSIDSFISVSFSDININKVYPFLNYRFINSVLLQVPVSNYAIQCSRRLMRLPTTRQKPTLNLIQESRIHIFNPPQFSAPLEELMEMQAEKYPERFSFFVFFKISFIAKNFLITLIGLTYSVVTNVICDLHVWKFVFFGVKSSSHYRIR